MGINYCNVKRNFFFPSHNAHRAALMRVSLDTSLHYQTTLVHRAVCMFTSQFSLVLIVPTYIGMARLSGRLHAKTLCPRAVIHLSTNLAQSSVTSSMQLTICYR